MRQLDRDGALDTRHSTRRTRVRSLGSTIRERRYVRPTKLAATLLPVVKEICGG